MKHPHRLPLLACLSILAASGAASATAVSGQGTWESTLQARDINGDGQTDAYYDTSTNLTWLADANLIKTSGYPGFPSETYPQLAPLPSGEVNWFVADSWIYGVRTNGIYGVTGWRLPTVVNQTSCIAIGSHSSCNRGVAPGTSELENLILTTLGNQKGQLTNTGPFSNVQAGRYWTQTQVQGYPSGSNPFWVYNVASGLHEEGPQDFGYNAFAWVVRTGDVPVVPEPSTYALLMCGLAVTYAVRHRAAKQPG